MGDKYGGGYSQKDAAKDTRSSSKDTAKAHHEARNHAAKSGGWGVPKNRSSRSSSKSSKRK